jgi:hypothetical protein
MAIRAQSINFKNPGDRLLEDMYIRAGITRQVFTSLGNAGCFLALYLNNNLNLPRYNYTFASSLLDEYFKNKPSAPVLRERARTGAFNQITIEEVKKYYEYIANEAVMSNDGQLYLALGQVGRLGFTEHNVRDKSVYLPELSPDKRMRYYSLAVHDSEGHIGGLATRIAITFPGGIIPEGLEESLSPTARTLFDASQSWIMV